MVAMTTATTSYTLATSAAATASRHRASSPRNAALVKSEFFSTQQAALRMGAFTSTRPVLSRRVSGLTVCKISKGDIVPPVGLKDQDGRLVNLDRFRGKPLVLYFYPADETPGCTKQACAFRDSYEKFRKAGAEVVGVSGDTPDSHKSGAFWPMTAIALNLKFIALSLGEMPLCPPTIQQHNPF